MTDHELTSYYITFGSDRKFPFQDTYLVIRAKNATSAMNKFRAKYPDRPDNMGILNFSFAYLQDEWDNGVSECYRGQKPADVIK